MKAAIRDDNPVLFFEHKRLYSMKGETGPDDEVIPFGHAKLVCPGSDLTVVTAMKSVHDALAAAEQLTTDGIELEVIDLRTMRPLDEVTILESVRKTNRLLVLEEGPRVGGWAGEVLAAVTELAIEELDDAWRLTTPDVPIPYSPPLEDAFFPSTERIVDDIRARLGVDARSTPVQSAA